ncbi:zinc ribbon domain-containing protein [Bacteriovorax sp. Seq25_V]|uniref:zinc ribbon domain-containing protein n=1 Tax=Bacteriovorax sp. Seq25_V TaxID=1201288 RepID=UPI00038A486F|nr:zinc ribbon domain-containing protein [Bacteriovorax sp. Seq25_V]EQC47180.1 zinc-ribbon domain protein [Bacteriovorax sp. Seq25_V]
MALINCPECKKEVSDKASACPNCGNPLSSHIQKNHEAEDKITSSTSIEVSENVKKSPWGSKVIGAILCISAIPLALSVNLRLGGVMFFIGFALFIIGRFGD